MNTLTYYEAEVDQDKIILTNNVRLPHKSKVYVVVPDIKLTKIAHIFSPRLARPEQAADFVLQVTEEPDNDNI